MLIPIRAMEWHSEYDWETGISEGRMEGDKVEMRVINNSFENFLCEEEQRSGEVPKENLRSREDFF